MNDGDPTTASQGPWLACVSLERCVLRRSVDGEQSTVAFGESRTGHYGVRHRFHPFELELETVIDLSHITLWLRRWPNLMLDIWYDAVLDSCFSARVCRNDVFKSYVLCPSVIILI